MNASATSKVRAPALAALAGVLFGVGLALSGMTQPAKVLGFLDVTGRWDPSLMFVMGGALAVHTLLTRVVLQRPRPLFDDDFHLPAKTTVDNRLVAGAALFGIGWGLGGFCPGPALVSAASGALPAVVFAIAMSAGMVLQHLTLGARAGGGGASAQRGSAPPPP